MALMVDSRRSLETTPVILGRAIALYGTKPRLESKQLIIVRMLKVINIK